MQDTQDRRMAVLIDADNAPRKSLKNIMEEVAVYGNPTIKRIYGDWTHPSMNTWKQILLENAITPIQQYGYTTGKNSTDSAMIIDAMDILYAGQVEAFCLVSSDSDFTRLAVRLREAGKTVIGLGERKTPGAFIKACDRFIYIEILNENKRRQQKPAAPKPKRDKPSGPAPAEADAPAAPDPVSDPPPQPEVKAKNGAQPGIPQDIIDFIAGVIDDVGDEEGWAYLGEVGSLIQKKQPDFDPRNFGYKRLTLMIEACDCFSVEARDNVQKGNGKLIYISNKTRG
ncbi:MAG: NYN domain-containing protein [Oscillospiraceae bacterium]|nr:NYN domain-containing protein [Oscillospiraceae bacterium]